MGSEAGHPDVVRVPSAGMEEEKRQRAVREVEVEA